MQERPKADKALISAMTAESNDRNFNHNPNDVDPKIMKTITIINADGTKEVLEPDSDGVINLPPTAMNLSVSSDAIEENNQIVYESIRQSHERARRADQLTSEQEYYAAKRLKEAKNAKRNKKRREAKKSKRANRR